MGSLASIRRNNNITKGNLRIPRPSSAPPHPFLRTSWALSQLLLGPVPVWAQESEQALEGLEKKAAGLLSGEGTA